MAKRITSGIWTVCLDTQKTDDETYHNWITFRLIREAKGTWLVARKSNANGNGQTWDVAGRIDSGQLRLNGTDGLTVACGTILARYFGLGYANETVVLFPRSYCFRPKGRKTAAPSLLGPTRDKNVNNAHAKAKALTVAEMRARLETARK